MWQALVKQHDMLDLNRLRQAAGGFGGDYAPHRIADQDKPSGARGATDLIGNRLGQRSVDADRACGEVIPGYEQVTKAQCASTGSSTRARKIAGSPSTGRKQYYHRLVACHAIPAIGHRRHAGVEQTLQRRKTGRMVQSLRRHGVTDDLLDFQQDA